MRKVGYLFGALLFLATALTPVFAQQPFADVPLNHWAYNAVNSLAEQGLLEGYPDSTFQGKQRLTRYEFAQAVARLMDRMEQMGGIPGPPGPPGAPGPPGVGAGLTPEQKATLDRLAKEFGPELKALRSDLDSLTERVEDLEAAPKAELPAITVSGDISWRVGLYGTSLGSEDVKSTGYPVWATTGAGAYDPQNPGQLPAFGWIPVIDPVTHEPLAAFGILDSTKDAFKVGDFMTMRARLNFSGKADENTDVMICVLGGPTTEIFSPLSVLPGVGTGEWRGHGGTAIMDAAELDQMWVKHRTQFIAPVTLTVGKQYVRRAQGLLFDNDLMAIKGLRADFGTKVGFGSFLAMLDRDAIGGINASGTSGVDTNTGEPLETDGQDNYDLFYLDWPLGSDWVLGVNWLESGYGDEQGWSASLDGELHGLDFYGEYAKLTESTDGQDFLDWNGDGVQDINEVSIDESDTAWLAGLGWANDPVCVTGEYGQIDAGYGLVFPGLPLTSMFPRAVFDPHDINWVDRELFLDPTNIAKGWHVNVTFPDLLGENTPVSISYSDGDAYNPEYLGWLWINGPGNAVAEPDKWRDADSVWTIKASKQLSESVTANLVYGRREAQNVMSPGEVPVGTDPTTADPIYATDDAIQVIRAEVCVAF